MNVIHKIIFLIYHGNQILCLCASKAFSRNVQKKFPPNCPSLNVLGQWAQGTELRKSSRPIFRQRGPVSCSKPPFGTTHPPPCNCKLTPSLLHGDGHFLIILDSKSSNSLQMAVASKTNHRNGRSSFKYRKRVSNPFRREKKCKKRNICD